MYLAQFSLLLSFAFFPVLTKVLPPVILAARRDLSINDATKELTVVNNFFGINQTNETNSNREVQHILGKRQQLTENTTKEPIVADEEDIVDVTFVRAEKHLGRFLFVSLPVAIILILFTLIMCILTRPGTHFMGYFERPHNELCRHQQKTVNAVKRKYETGAAGREKKRAKRLAREKAKKKGVQPKKVIGKSEKIDRKREERKAKLLAQKEKKKKRLEKKREALLKKRGQMYKTDHEKKTKEYEAMKGQKEKGYAQRRLSQQRSSGSLRAPSSKSLLSSQSLSSRNLSSKNLSSKSLSSEEMKSKERLSKVKLQEKKDIIKDAEKARKRKAKAAKKAERTASLSRIDSQGRVRGPRRKGG